MTSLMWTGDRGGRHRAVPRSPNRPAALTEGPGNDPPGLPNKAWIRSWALGRPPLSDEHDLSVGAPNDELSGEVSFGVSYDSSGLSIKGKSRLLAAADRLLGGIVGIPAEAVEGVRRRVKLRAEQREEMIRLDARKAIEVLANVSDLGRATAGRFIEQELKKQANRDAVWSATEEALLALPAPAAPGESEHVAADGEDLDEDWLNIFSRHADDASSARLQQLWGRILAGEIRKPGSFAPTTLRVIAELDADIASAFQKWAALAIGGRLLKPDELSGPLLDELTFLEEVGLLQDVNGMLSVTMTPENGFVVIIGEKYGLRARVAPGHPKASLPVIMVTRVGRQIAQILPRQEITALKEFGERLEKSGSVVNGSIHCVAISARTSTSASFHILPFWPAEPNG